MQLRLNKRCKRVTAEGSASVAAASDIVSLIVLLLVLLLRDTVGEVPSLAAFCQRKSMLSIS